MQIGFEEQWKQLANRESQPDRMDEQIGVYTSEEYIKLVAPAYYFKGILPTVSLDEMDELIMKDIYMWAAGMAREQWVWDEVQRSTRSKAV